MRKALTTVCDHYASLKSTPPPHLLLAMMRACRATGDEKKIQKKTQYTEHATSSSVCVLFVCVCVCLELVWVSYALLLVGPLVTRVADIFQRRRTHARTNARTQARAHTHTHTLIHPSIHNDCKIFLFLFFEVFNQIFFLPSKKKVQETGDVHSRCYES